MRLLEFFAEEHIAAELASTRKSDALEELVQKLCDSGCLRKSEVQDVLRALMRREELGTTGIGKGVAVPHAKHAGVRGVVGALGRSTKGVEFDALDGQPVYLIFLIVSSPDAVEPHLKALKKVTALLRDEDLCAFLKRAKDQAELTELLDEAEERLAQL